MSFLWLKGKKQERKKRRPKGKYRVVFGVRHHDETGRNYNRIPFLDPAMGREAQRIRGNCSYILPCVLSICSFCFSNMLTFSFDPLPCKYNGATH